MRKSGDVTIRERLRELLAEDQVAWCEVVRVELWRGARGDADFKTLRELEIELPRLEISAAVWDKCCDMARRCRPKGYLLPTTDMLVYSCAVVHGVQLLHRDRHFDLLAEIES
jgi:hypothetical protein